MSNLVEDLKKYFQNNSNEQIMKDWEESKEYDNIGPSIHEFIKESEIFFKQDQQKIPKIKINSTTINEPEVCFGFLITNN